MALKKSLVGIVFVWMFLCFSMPTHAGISGSSLVQFVQEESEIFKSIFGLGTKGVLKCKTIFDTQRVANCLIEDLGLLNSLKTENPVYKMMIEYLFLDAHNDDTSCVVTVEQNNSSFKKLALKGIDVKTDFDKALKNGESAILDITELCRRHAPERIVQSVQIVIKPLIEHSILYGFIITKHTQAFQSSGALFKQLFLASAFAPSIMLDFKPSCGFIFFAIVSALLHDVRCIVPDSSFDDYYAGGENIFEHFWFDRSHQIIVLKGSVECFELLSTDALDVQKYLGQNYNKTYVVDITARAQRYNPLIEKYVFFIKGKLSNSSFELSIQGYCKFTKERLDAIPMAEEDLVHRRLILDGVPMVEEDLVHRRAMLDVNPMAESIDEQEKRELAMIAEEQVPVRKIMYPHGIETVVLHQLFDNPGASELVLQVADTNEMAKALMLFYMVGQRGTKEQCSWYTKASGLVMHDAERGQNSKTLVVLKLNNNQEIDSENTYCKDLLAQCRSHDGIHGSFCSDMTICVRHEYKDCQRYWMVITPLVQEKSVYGFVITKYCSMRPTTSL